YEAIFGQLRKTTTVNSGGEKVDRYFIYPYDYIQPNIWLRKLLEKNIIGTPIETITLADRSQDKSITEGQYSTYDNYGRRLAVFGLNLDNNGIKVEGFKISNRLKGILPPEGSATAFQPDARYEKKIECLDYDLFNNIREVLENGNLSTVYLWGYGGQYPIAEIKNSTYSEVVAVLTQPVIDNFNLTTHSEATMETLIKNSGDKLRAGLPNAMVTSYTYKPLVGMTSKTDARGVKETYKYDGMQRLKAVLDHLNNVTKSIDYHYRSN